jgi:ubiquinone/menaquinone biosynthesis C-methylase UbiE
MKTQLLALILFSGLNGMEFLYETQKSVQTETHFDLWEFFSEPNSLDKLGDPIVVWNKKSFKNSCDLCTTANLHIIQKSGLPIKDRIILDPECNKGHIVAFLAQNSANSVYGYDNNSKNIVSAEKKYKKYHLKNLIFSHHIPHIVKPNFYDLIVCGSPSTDIEKLQRLRALLKPQGEIFCIFTTRSNLEPVEATVLREMLPTIEKNIIGFEKWKCNGFIAEENKRYPMEETVKNMIADSGFDIITFEQKNFTIQIHDMDKFQNLHKSIFVNLPFLTNLISNQKRREKIANEFIRRIIKRLQKDVSGNWLYPCSKTIVHIRKK